MHYGIYNLEFHKKKNVLDFPKELPTLSNYFESYRKIIISVFGILVSLDVYFNLGKIQSLIISPLFYILFLSLTGGFWKKISELTLK